MKKLIFLTSFLLPLFIIWGCKREGKVEVQKEVKKEVKKEISKGVKAMMDKITWYGHASFQIRDDVTLYIDPYNLKAEDLEPADLILITHNHFDHCSSKDVKRISSPNTVIVTVEECQEELGVKAVLVKPGDKIVEKGIIEI
ncbi:MAG: MBL fold metallo-hydrolase [Fidelibacterota bacterium]